MWYVALLRYYGGSLVSRRLYYACEQLHRFEKRIYKEIKCDLVTWNHSISQFTRRLRCVSPKDDNLLEAIVGGSLSCMKTTAAFDVKPFVLLKA